MALRSGARSGLFTLIVLVTLTGGLKAQTSQPTSELKDLPEVQALARSFEKSGGTLRFHQLRAGKPGTDGWVVAHSTAGGFTVELPAPYNDFSADVPAKDKVIISTHCVGTLLGGTKFATSYVTRADGKAAPEGGRDARSLAANFARVPGCSGMREITWEKITGYEVRIDKGDTGAVIRAIDVAPGKVLFQIAEHQQRQDRAPEKDIQRFMESLKWAKERESGEPAK